MRTSKPALVALQVVAIAVGTVCSGVAVNQLRLDRLSWPWLVAAVVSAAVVAAVSLFGAAKRPANRAVAKGGGNADAGNTGRLPRKSPLPSNDARATGPGSVARAGDMYFEAQDRPFRSQAPAGE